MIGLKGYDDWLEQPYYQQDDNTELDLCKDCDVEAVNCICDSGE